MVIISTPLSIILVATGVAGMAVAGPRGLRAPRPAAGMVSQTMAGAVTGMAVVAMPGVATGSPGNQERRHPTEAGLRRIATDLHPIAGEDSVKVILTV
jgi:hypothetical protein